VSLALLTVDDAPAQQELLSEQFGPLQDDKPSNAAYSSASAEQATAEVSVFSGVAVARSNH